MAAIALVSVVTNAAQSRLAIIEAAQKRSDGIAQYRDRMRSAGEMVIGERAPPRRRLTNTPHFKLERRRFFSIILDTYRTDSSDRQRVRVRSVD